MVQLLQPTPNLGDCLERWKICDDNREFMVDQVFAGGYSDPNNPAEQSMIRWTKQEMLDLCTDQSLISLFQRYVAWYPTSPIGRSKEDFLRDIEVEIAVENALA